MVAKKARGGTEEETFGGLLGTFWAAFWEHFGDLLGTFWGSGAHVEAYTFERGGGLLFAAASMSEVLMLPGDTLSAEGELEPLFPRRSFALCLFGRTRLSTSAEEQLIFNGFRCTVIRFSCLFKRSAHSADHTR